MKCWSGLPSWVAGASCANLLAPVAGLHLPSLLKPGPLRQAIEDLVPARRFSDLGVPLTVTAVDLDSGELVLFGAGAQVAPLVDVLCARLRAAGLLPTGGPGRTPLRRRRPPRRTAARARGRARVELVVAVDVGPGFDRPPPAQAPRQSPPRPGPRRCGRDPHGCQFREPACASGAPIRPALPWCMCGRPSNATPPSGSTACGSMRRQGYAPRARRSPVRSRALDRLGVRSKLSDYESL